MSDLLTAAELSAKLKKCPEWDLEEKEITRLIEFESFQEAIDFVNDLAEVAEEVEHHPDIDIRYSKIILRLTTHEEGGITAADLELAHRIDNMLD